MEHEKYAIPIVIRLSLFVIIPVVHWLFHRLIEHGISSAEKLEQFKRITHRFRFVPDIILILALIGFHFVME